ncbi:hypothetical protein THAOC_37224, partial [Thalassiosira oceanica]
ETEQVRLQKQALRQDLLCQTETDGAREARLKADRANKEWKREAETEDAQEARLQADRANKESKREAETEDARILRLQDNPQRGLGFMLLMCIDTVKKVQIVCDLFSEGHQALCVQPGSLEDLILVCLARSLGVLSRVIFQKSSHLSDLTRQLILEYAEEYAEKLVVESFEEDTGLKMRSGVAENDEEEQDKEGQTGDSKESVKSLELHFTLALKKHRNKHLRTRATLRRRSIIKADKTKMRRLAEKGGEREQVRLPAKANKDRPPEDALEDLILVSGKITESVGSADLPDIITAAGPYKTAHSYCGMS